MPLPISLAHKLSKRLTDVRKQNIIEYLRPDGKVQVTVEYEGSVPKRIDTIVVSTQHKEDANLDQLKKDIKEKKEKQNKEKAKYETEEAVIKAVCEDMKVEIPQGMIETETQNMLKDIETRLSYQGLKLEQYLQMMGKTAEEVKKEYEPQAIEAIKSRLALEAIVKAEKIEASEEKINEKLEEMAKNYGKTAEELKANENVKNYIKEGIESQEAIEFLVKNAKIK